LNPFSGRKISNGSFSELLMSTATPESILKQYWGHDHFRLLQREIVQAALDRNDVLALLPTGGGKSVCFQVPGLLLDGITLVISPLIALMQDQVQQLRNKGIAALSIHSGMKRREIDIALDNCIYGKYKFLYLSPERLQTELFIERFKKMNVSFIAVDEAHCISQWGYDFRPPYLTISSLREIKPDIKFLALTATATPEVKEDIIQKLRLKNPSIFQKSFSRSNLSLVVRKTENKEKKLLEILRKVPGSGIVYVRSRKATVDLSKWLQRQKIPSTFYHAGLTHQVRMARQEEWISDATRVMVATNAFGMGIDKSSVRVVVHLDLPENLESYFQEAGRAGRDEKRAYAALVYHESDVSRLRANVQQSYPTIDYLKKIYQALANYLQLAEGSSEGESYEFDLDEFCKKFSLRGSAAFAGLKKLEEEGLIQLSESFARPSRIHFTMDKAHLYEFQVANAKFDPLIKSTLRLYGAEVFSDFIPVSEWTIAKALKQSEGEVTANFQQLAKMQLLDYEPASEKPRITFLLARQDAERLPLDVNRLNQRRDLAGKKAEAMIGFAEQRIRCRMQVIMDYFGEESFETCGACDVCMERKKVDSAPSLKEYREKINYLLSQRAMTVDELEEAAIPHDRDLFVEVVREMVDQGKVAYDEFWVLRIVK
jgi:ATP-dependent DNA helicase RecQ